LAPSLLQKLIRFTNGPVAEARDGPPIYLSGKHEEIAGSFLQ
jgi:hypothetical protein